MMSSGPCPRCANCSSPDRYRRVREAFQPGLTILPSESSWLQFADLLIFARTGSIQDTLHQDQMITRKLLASLALGILFSTVAVAQGKLAEEADQAFQKGFYFNAIELYKKAYTVEKQASRKAELIFMVAESYRALGDNEQAEIWYEKANKAQYPDPITYFYIGEALKQQGKYADAIAAYNRYKEKKPNDARADAGIAAAQLAQKWQDSPTRYTVDPEVLLNTPQYDFTPAYADKNNIAVVFTSTRQASTGTETDQILGENFSDLFTSTQDRLGKWSEPVKLPSNINTMGNEGAPVFNADRTIMYFTRCPFEKKKVFGCDIYMSSKVGNNYSEPEMLALKGDQGKDDTTTVGHPTLSPDGKFMIYSSNVKREGHKGGKDLYLIALNEEGKPTGQPVNLGAEINTNKDELFPSLRFDGSLYFSTTGLQGMGGMDIFRAEPTGDKVWGNVDNMKSPINSAYDDFGIVFDAENDRGFFTSNRPGGKGMDDIWRFYMPNLEFALQGVVYDKSTNLPIPGVRLNVVGTNGSNFNKETDENGGFEFVEDGKDRYIKENTTYTINIEADNYLAINDQVTTVGLNESTTFVKEYYLQPAGVGEVVNLPTLLYDTDKFELLQAAKDSLQIAYETLVNNPRLVVQLRSHTDARPTRTYKGGNMELSQLRAQSVVNYLVQLGIDPARLVPIGRGAEEPRIPMDQINKMATKEEKEAAHQANRRTDFKILSWDFVPKEGNNLPNNN